MVVLRLFGAFLLSIVNTARKIVYIVMRIFSFIINIIALISIISIIIAVKSWIVSGWSDMTKVQLQYSLIIFAGGFIYHLVMYIMNPNK